MAEERLQRRLAAILSADVVGYSRLMGLDEAGTLSRLNALRRGMIDPAIAAHSGRIVKLMGDGALVEFASAVDAVTCAIEIQKQLMEHDAGGSDADPIRFRIGINIGDIIIEGDDILGDGVNIAARIEGIAEPGGISISEDVWRQVQGKVAANFVDIGEQSLKNIVTPVRVYRVQLGGGSATKPTALALALPDKPSIAVLPFQNMSGDVEQDYFCDGMVEEIITGLSRIKWLFVIARNSSFTYKGRAVDVREVGRKLGVRYVLEGSVRKGGNRLRITVQLVDAATGNHLWADKYDGVLNDVFDLQDQITAGVVGAIEPNVRHAEIERATRKRPENLGAYDLYLRALPRAGAHSPADSVKALELIEAALKIDPGYGAAHALAAYCHYVQFTRGGRDPAQQAAAVHHAREAIATGTDDASALATAAFVLALLGGNFDAALSAFDRALAINPNSAPALGRAAQVNVFVRNYDKAIDQANRSIRLSPLDPLRYQPELALALAYFLTDRFLAAADAARQAVQSSPSFNVPLLVLAASYVRLGRLADARAEVRRALEVHPNFTIAALTMVGFDADQRQALAAALREAGMPG
jgi:adenylate cyclase